MARLNGLLPGSRERMRPDVSFAIVNVVMLLILFFLATGALLNTPTMGINIAETENLPIERLPKPVLAVQPDGVLELDGLEIAKSALGPALADARILHVLIDREAPATDLVTLLDAPEFAHLEVRLVTARQQTGN